MKKIHFPSEGAAKQLEASTVLRLKGVRKQQVIRQLIAPTFIILSLNNSRSEKASKYDTMTSPVDATAPPRMLFRQAAMLNAHGIECLTTSDGEGAYRSFKRALQVVTQMTKDLDSQQLEDVLQEERMEAVEALEIWPSPAPVPGVGDSCYYVYNHALLFCPPSSPSQFNMVQCVAALIFNSALTFHQQGLPKALSLYEQVVAIVQASSMIASTEEHEMVHTLQVIARNNHIQILLTMGQVDKVNEGLEELRDWLPCLQIQDEEELGTDPLLVTDDEVLDELALNTLVPGTKLTAAAA